MRIRTLALPALLACAAAVAAAQDADIKPGLWEMKTAMAGMGEGFAMQTCIGPQTSAMRSSQPDQGRVKCESESARKEGDKWFFESVCRDGARTIATKGVVSGRFDSNYRIDVRNTYSPPLDGRKEDSMTTTMRYLGPCQPGMKPGDTIMPGMPPGMKLPK